MTENPTPETSGTSGGISRRTLAKGAAWTIPAVALAIGTPAMAASAQVIHITWTTVPPSAAAGTTFPTFVGHVTINGQPAPAGTVVTYGNTTGGITLADGTTGTEATVTDASGNFTVTGVKAVTAGPATIYANTPGGDGPVPANVNVTAPASVWTIAYTNSPTAVAGQYTAGDPQVVVELNGVVQNNIPVTFTIVSGPGQYNNGNVKNTNASGNAALDYLQATGTTAGTIVLKATLPTGESATLNIPVTASIITAGNITFDQPTYTTQAGIGYGTISGHVNLTSGSIYPTTVNLGYPAGWSGPATATVNPTTGAFTVTGATGPLTAQTGTFTASSTNPNITPGTTQLATTTTSTNGLLNMWVTAQNTNSGPNPAGSTQIQWSAHSMHNGSVPNPQVRPSYIILITSSLGFTSTPPNLPALLVASGPAGDNFPALTWTQIDSTHGYYTVPGGTYYDTFGSTQGGQSASANGLLVVPTGSAVTITNIVNDNDTVSFNALAATAFDSVSGIATPRAIGTPAVPYAGVNQ